MRRGLRRSETNFQLVRDRLWGLNRVSQSPLTNYTDFVPAKHFWPAECLSCSLFNALDLDCSQQLQVGSLLPTPRHSLFSATIVS